MLSVFRISVILVWLVRALTAVPSITSELCSGALAERQRRLLDLLSRFRLLKHHDFSNHGASNATRVPRIESRKNRNLLMKGIVKNRRNLATGK